MGIWGIDGPPNDEALLWLADLVPASGVQPLYRALRSVADAADPHVEAGRAQTALAAAELVAALHGQPSASLPPAARDWIAAQGGAQTPRRDADLELRILATRALDLVVTSSQLADQRSIDATSGERWRRALDDLRMRLAAAGGMPRNPLAS